MDTEFRSILVLKTEATFSVEAFETSIRLDLRGAKIQETTKCTMYVFLLECTINNNSPHTPREFTIRKNLRFITHIAYRKMLQIKLSGLHELKLVLLYNGQFLRAPTDFRLSVLQNTGYILLINIYFWTHNPY